MGALMNVLKKITLHVLLRLKYTPQVEAKASFLSKSDVWTWHEMKRHDMKNLVL